MQFGCERCGQCFKLNESGRLACRCGEMTEKQDENIALMILSYLLGGGMKDVCQQNLQRP